MTREEFRAKWSPRRAEWEKLGVLLSAGCVTAKLTKIAPSTLARETDWARIKPAARDLLIQLIKADTRTGRNQPRRST